jgi:hypothetical protein
MIANISTGFPLAALAERAKVSVAPVVERPAHHIQNTYGSWLLSAFRLFAKSCRAVVRELAKNVHLASASLVAPKDGALNLYGQ